MLLSGMSTSVVTPPAAAARVAVSKPSHAVRPGLVDVHVRVDDAGHENFVAEVLDRTRRVLEGANLRDAPAFHVDRRRTDLSPGDHALASEHEHGRRG